MPHPYETKEDILKLGEIDPELDEVRAPILYERGAPTDPDSF